MVDIAQAPKRKTASEVPVHLQSNASYGASLVLQRALTGSLGPGDGGGSEELLQRLLSANHSYQDATDEKLARVLKERLNNIMTHCTHGASRRWLKVSTVRSCR